MYSKRWYLIHLLGGRCFDCGNENFYDLEIDHINNDGDGERKYYTRMEKHYLDNPKRAKARLQVLCKACHENKHHQNIKWKEQEPRISVGVWPVRNGKMINDGTEFGDIDELVIAETDGFRYKKELFRYEVNPKILPQKENKIKLFMDILKGLEFYSSGGVEEKILITELINTGKFSEEESRNYIRKLLREASIYESRPAYYLRV